MDVDKVAYIIWCVVFLILCFVVYKNLRIPAIILDVIIVVNFILVAGLIYFHLIFYAFLAISVFALLYVLRIRRSA
jgi:hypothetical protein